MNESDAILTYEGVQKLDEHLRWLKGDGRLPRRRLYQIAQVFWQMPYAIKGQPNGDGLAGDLERTAYGTLIDRIVETIGGRQGRVSGNP